VKLTLGATLLNALRTSCMFVLVSLCNIRMSST
jgi:hypothetical protein